MIQSICLFPVLRRAGFSMRLRWDLRRNEIGEIGRMAGWMFGYVASQALGNLVVQRAANAATNTALAPRRHDAAYYTILLERLAALPAPVRDRRDLGHQRAAAADERSRQRTAVLAGPGRLLQGRADRLGHRGARRDLPRRDGRAACASSCSLHGHTDTAQARGRSARSSASSRSAWCRSCSPSCSCGCSTRSTRTGQPAIIGMVMLIVGVIGGRGRGDRAPLLPDGDRPRLCLRSGIADRRADRLAAAAAPGGQPGRLADHQVAHPDAARHAARAWCSSS